MTRVRLGPQHLDWAERRCAVLTWISIYWFSRAGPAASLRIYYEVSEKDGIPPSMYEPLPTIPLGYSYFPGEVFDLPRRCAHFSSSLRRRR